MDDTIKKCKLNIFGDNYSIITNEPEDILIEAAKIVDCQMRNISAKSPSLDLKKAAILTALQMTVQQIQDKRVVEIQNFCISEVVSKISEILTKN